MDFGRNDQAFKVTFLSLSNRETDAEFPITCSVVGDTKALGIFSFISSYESDVSFPTRVTKRLRVIINYLELSTKSIRNRQAS